MAGGHKLGRREALRSATLIALIGLAGCSGAPSGEDSIEPTATEPQPEPDPEPTDDPIPEEVFRSVDDAGVDLEAAQAGFADEIDKLEDSLSYVQFETSPIRGDIAAARANLDRAEEAAGTDPPAGIETLWQITDWFALLVDGLATYGEGLGSLETAELYGENNRLEDGEAEAEIAVSAFEETVAMLEQAEGDLAAIDLASLEGLIDASPDQVRLSLEETGGQAERLRGYAEGLTYYVRGTVNLIIGLDHYQTEVEFAQAGAWDDTLAEFDVAEARFDAANSESTEGEPVAPVELLDRFISLTCESGHYLEATGHLVDAIHALVAGDEETQQAAFAAWNEAELAVGSC